MAENPGTESVSDLIESVDKGEYVIPYFQRGYEWQPRMVCDLFESILQDYYAGLILFWELDKEAGLQLKQICKMFYERQQQMG